MRSCPEAAPAAGSSACKGVLDASWLGAVLRPEHIRVGRAPSLVGWKLRRRAGSCVKCESNDGGCARSAIVRTTFEARWAAAEDPPAHV